MHETINSKHLTFNEAKKLINSMNLINNFLWDSANENKEDSKKIAEIILSTVLGYHVQVDDVDTQKVFSGIDTIYHGIRMDAHILSTADKHKAVDTSYDIEMEDREADRAELPRRSRFYSAISDSKNLPSNNVARSRLITHPDYDYDDGRTNIFLYAGGNPNFPNESYGKKVTELLKYIVSGAISSSPDKNISELDTIVRKVKSRPEVTTKLMKQWDRERIHDLELTEKVTATVTVNVRQEDALKMIRSNRRYNISDENTRQDLTNDYGYDEKTIDDLFAEADKP